MPPRRSKTRKAKPKPRGVWVWAPATVQPEDPMRQDVENRARELIDTVFRPRYVQPPPQEPRFNYVIDIVGSWHRGFYYFTSIYACPDPDALSPTFEAPFARLRHVAGGTFGLAYMRHTDQWWELYHGLTLDEAFAAIREQMHFWPVT